MLQKVILDELYMKSVLFFSAFFRDEAETSEGFYD